MSKQNQMGSIFLMLCFMAAGILAVDAFKHSELKKNPEQTVCQLLGYEKWDNCLTK
jgi:hypothetical protein